jgi:hypothetical protein
VVGCEAKIGQHPLAERATVGIVFTLTSVFIERHQMKLLPGTGHEFDGHVFLCQVSGLTPGTGKVQG